MTRVPSALALGLVLLLTGCGSSSASSAGLVRTSGVFMWEGGTSAPAHPLAGVRFAVTGSGESASGVSDINGRFAFDVTPGRYTVEITGHSPRLNGRLLQPQPDTIVVKPGGKRVRLIVTVM